MQKNIFRNILSAKNYKEFKQLLENSNCNRCPLSRSRTHIVVDRGNPKSKTVIIGEAPGEKEDLQGSAFVGRAGKILDQMFAEANIDTNENCLIMNVVKCRPPKNRAPKTVEADACSPYFTKQIDFIRPKLIVLLGATALKHIVKEKKYSEMNKEAGKFFVLPEYPGVQFFVIYHPAYLLYNAGKKYIYRNHLKKLKKYMQEKGIYSMGNMA